MHDSRQGAGHLQMDIHLRAQFHGVISRPSQMVGAYQPPPMSIELQVDQGYCNKSKPSYTCCMLGSKSQVHHTVAPEVR